MKTMILAARRENDGNPDYSGQNAPRRRRNVSILDSDARDSDDTPVTAQFTFNGQLRLDLYLNVF